ncbi:M50 family metallopeptidase [Roseobacter sp. HKCCA0434]|uniref:M50 family metallopeptidase n=1 Tax=Roseobacter sp. HKCCA0434 TaxID=3079297 RepID=UPI0029058354|nr:M50 family metallopeptidase [Roseobacter sp. HKCCA0434]
MSGLTGAGALREVRVHLSEEGGRHLYLLSDPASGRILRLQPGLARIFGKVSARLRGRGEGDVAEEEIAAATVIGEFVRAMRADASGERRRKFNPLFMQIPLFDVGPWQKSLGWLAAATFSRVGAVLFVLASLFCLWVHAVSDGAMISRIGDVFSLQAIATFAIIAPLTKILHELGHVLAATAQGVRVRKAGVMLLGLYPLPYVDCSEADLLADRRGRILISLGGLFADLTVAMVAFIAWHLVEGEVARQILSSLFVFNSINTLVFNINPILKLDGYFALSDALHRRNWHTESFVAFRALRTALARFSAGDSWRALANAPLRIAFACLSSLYKVWIVAFVAWQVLPKFLGLGLFIVGWGLVAMFLTPLMSLAGPSVQGRGQGATVPRKAVGGCGWLWVPLLSGALVLIGLVPRPFVLTVPVLLDLDGSYAVRTREGGIVERVRPAGPVIRDEMLLALIEPGADADLALAEAEAAFDAAVAEGAAGQEPLTVQAARERAATSAGRVSRLRDARASRQIIAARAGHFRPVPRAREGVRLVGGDVFGHLLPQTGETWLTGAFPERWVEKFTQDRTQAELRLGDDYLPLDAQADLIVEQMQVDGISGLRLRVQADIAPSRAAGQPTHVRITFAEAPLWQHAQFKLNDLILRFREAQRAAQIDATE